MTARGRGRPALALLVAFAATLLPASAASAAPTWLERVGVSQTGPQFQTPTDIAVAPDGAAVAGWIRPVGGIGRAEVAVRPPGTQQFGSPQTLSDTTKEASRLRVAIDAAGNAAAAFIEGDKVRASLRPPGGQFAQAATLGSVDLFPATTIPTSAPDVAIAQGAAIATWVHDKRIKASFRPANSPNFGPTEDLAGTSEASVPNVVMDPAANAYLTFRQLEPGKHRIRVAVREPTKSLALTNDPLTFEPTAQFPDGLPSSCPVGTNHVDPPQIAVDPQGRATVAFAFNDCRTGRHVIKSSARSTSGNFGALDDVSDPAVDSGALGLFDLAIDDENNAVIVWLAEIVKASARPSGGSFGEIQNVSGPGSFVSDPSVRFDPGGTAIAVFLRTTSSGPAIQSSARPRGGAFGAVIDISGANDPNVGSPLGGPTPVGVDDEGNAVALWRRTFDADPGAGVTEQDQVMAASFDAAPPVFTGGSIPASAIAGAPVAFAASAFDRLTGAAVTWSFGDGGSASGPAARHTFALPGAFTVTATATDAVGNARATSSTINIQAPPPVDRDDDGFTASQDCNDRNPRIRPNAREIPGNKVDENCDGRAAPFTLPPNLKAPVSWQRFTTFTKLTRLEVTGLRARAKVTLTCKKVKGKGKGKGPGCPFRTKKVKVRRGKASATRLVRKARFRTGSVLEIKVTTPGFLGLVRSARFVNAKDPRFVQRCQRPGAKKTRRCP